jgi:homoserine kinase
VSLNRSNLALADDILVPGSVANLGGGFDTLGVAVELYLRLRITSVVDDGGARLTVAASQPAIHGDNAVERAFALAALRTGRRAPTVVVEVESEIPIAAGLGSSAAATLAGLPVFERATGAMTEAQLLGLATEAEGHADNAAPALLGGLTSVLDGPGGPIAFRWHWPQGLRLVVATPRAGLATVTARAALPEMLSRTDAIYNLQRVLSLVHALQSGDDAHLREAVRDRWHQPARAALVPLLREALALEDPDILGVFLSGAGPSIAALARHRAARVEQLLRTMYEHAGCPATVRTLDVHQSSRALADHVASAHGRAV